MLLLLELYKTILVVHYFITNNSDYDSAQVEYYTFHDRDIAPEGSTLQETNTNLDAVCCYCFFFLLLCV